MKRVILHLGSAVFGALLLFSSCINDGEKTCDSYVGFSSTYNLHNADRFLTEANTVDLYMFDSNGNYLGKVVDQRTGGTFPAGHTLGLPVGLDRNTQFIAWTGLSSDYFTVPAMTVGQSKMEDLTVALKTTDGVSDKNLPVMMYGNVLNLYASRTLITYSNETTVVEMMKNTNLVRIALQAKVDGEIVPLSKNEFSFRIETDNGSYNYQNGTASVSTVRYEPYLTEESASLGAVAAELSLLRFREANPLHLVIEHHPADGESYTILDTDFKEYIDLLRFAKYSGMSLQEYMDRQDEYELVIILNQSSTPGPGGDKQWISAAVSINEFFVRDQSEDL